MQEPTLQQQIREYEANMPPEIMDIIKAFDWKKELRTIVNQNQIMIDVGSDLEESTYLMILGVVNVEDVYERLIEVHEYSEDKTKKILEEIEIRIFNQLSERLRVLDEKDAPKGQGSIVTRAQIGEKDPISASTQSSSEVTSDFVENITRPVDDSRDSILAEIEREEETEPVAKKETMPVIAPIEISSQGEIKKEPISQSIPQDAGVRKPFSMRDQESSFDTMKMPEAKPEVSFEHAPVQVAEKPVTGIQEDSMSSGFKTPVMMENKKTEEDVPTSAPASSQSKAFDPYREPIE